jgi:hypothetical protein
VQLNKALVGFLTHKPATRHGGNGYEGIAYLNDQFKDSGLTDPSNKDHGIDLKALAKKAVAQYAQYKTQKQTVGSLDIAKLPGVNHPVFKDKPVNHDPREVFHRPPVRGARRDQRVPRVLPGTGAGAVRCRRSRNVYCVNVDAVIAALLLKMLWKPLHAGEIGERDLETAAFTIFLYPRMLGCAAEIDDHLNRGRNMDTRTAASVCKFVA